MGKKFALLDRDGTIIRERNYLASPDEIELLPGAAEGLRRLRQAGYGLIILTNQAGIGRGYFSESQLARIHTKLEEILIRESVRLDAILYCPHAPEQGCGCRKPKTRMAEEAAAAFHFRPEQSVMIGDKPCDVELGRAFGSTTILVRSGYGRLYEAGGLQADYICDDLSAAATFLLHSAEGNH